MNDRLLRGALAGVIGETAWVAINLISERLLHFAKARWVQMLSHLVFGRTMVTPIDTTLAYLLCAIMGGGLGFAFARFMVPNPVRATTVVQEGIGLNGTKYFLDSHKDHPVDLFVAVDGGLGSVVYGALGIRWTKVIFTTPGGHTLRSWGKPSAVKSLGTAIASEAWVTVDARSLDGAILERMNQPVREIAEATAKRTGAEVKFELMTDIPGGQLAGAKESKLTQTVVDILTSLGVKSNLSADGHSVKESAEIEPLYTGIKQLFLLATRR